MKYILSILLLISVNHILAQKQLYIEIKDTVEVSYDIRHDGWEKKGFTIQLREVKDSVGLDTFRLQKFYYLDTVKNKVKRIYLEMSLKKIIGRRKGTDYRFIDQY